MPGELFVIQRWEAPDPAPSGFEVIGFHRGRGSLLQNYFDSRGIARLYQMSFESGATSPDLSPLDFHQRFCGRLGDDGRTISGRWKSSEDGTRWEHDFDLIYTRLE